MTSRSASLVIGLALALPALPAAAFENDPHACFSHAPNWNAGNGAVVSGVSPGPINAVLSAVGESRTHTMISNGTTGWATHSTTRQPSVQTGEIQVCGLFGCLPGPTIPLPNQPLQPLDLAHGSPGFSQINMGGAFAYWSAATQVWVTVGSMKADPPAPACGTICQESGVADWLYWTAPYRTVTSAADSGTTYYSVGINTGLASPFDFFPYPYGFHQYMAGSGRVVGQDSVAAPDTGIVCSQVPAYGFRKWVVATNPNLGGGLPFVLPEGYTQPQTVAAGNALWSNVYNACMGSVTSFWGQVGSELLSLNGVPLQPSTCANAAYQVLNCFFKGENSDGTGCTDVSSAPWAAYAANSQAAGAVSLSPDALLGISGHSSGFGTGPWAGQYQTALQWNGGGSTYGCYY